jgi:hypothetical protein
MRKITILFLIFLGFTARCMQTEPPGDRAVGIEYGDVINKSESSYKFSSDVYASAYRTDDKSYDDVTVEFYSKNRTLIASKNIGAIETGSRKTIQKQLSQRPEFIVVASSTFWEDSNLRVYGLSHKEGGIYVEYRVSENSLFRAAEKTTAER